MYFKQRIPHPLAFHKKLGAEADAKDYIDDFVHSDDKRFAGDSKRQRIRRALGAFYGKQMGVGVGSVVGAASFPGQMEGRKKKKSKHYSAGVLS